MPDKHTVSAGKVVTMHYKLTLDDGQVVDDSAGGEPMSYLHGSGEVVPGLETALEGRKAGDDVRVSVSPEQGYGHREPDAVQAVQRSAFPPNAKLDVGITFQAMDQDENPLLGTITKVAGDEVTVDFNHPLAGFNLHFEVRVTGVREATAEERRHGHVHGPGGHHH